MNRLRIAVIAVIGLFALVACNGEATAPPVEDLVTDIEVEMTTIGLEVDDSEVADEVQTDWNDLESLINDAVDSVLAEEDYDSAELFTELDSFEEQLEGAGDTVGQDVMDAWANMRDLIEQLTV